MSQSSHPTSSSTNANQNDKKRKNVDENSSTEPHTKKVATEENQTNHSNQSVAQPAQNSTNLLDSSKLRGLGPITDSESEEDEKSKVGNVQPKQVAQETSRTEAFRNYEDSSRQQTVANFYREHHRLQTYDYVLEAEKKFLKLDKKTMSLWEAVNFVDEIVDNSDPDTEDNQTIHLVQTAESLRKLFPGEEYDWLHLTGFLHDLGKLLAHPKMHNLDQVFVVGDTHPVGCAFDPSIVFFDFVKENPDYKNDKYNTKLGVYQEGCGLDKVHMTFGHDEYMYQVCKQNNSKLPEEALYIIRYHSFYPWHNKGAYDHLCNDKDRKMLEWVRKFQLHDLYSKLPERPDLKKTLPYYRKLMDKYFPPALRW